MIKRLFASTKEDGLQRPTNSCRHNQAHAGILLARGAGSQSCAVMQEGSSAT